MQRLERDIRLMALAGVVGPASDSVMRSAIRHPIEACHAVRDPGRLGRWARRVARRAIQDHSERTTTILFHPGDGGELAGGAVVTAHGATGSGNSCFDRPIQQWRPGLLRFLVWNTGLLPDAPHWMRQAAYRYARKQAEYEINQHI